MRKSIHSARAKLLQDLLRLVRQEADLTQVEVAARLGILQATVSNYERGERRLDLIELWQVCDALGVDVRDFVQRYVEICRDAEERTPAG